VHILNLENEIKVLAQ